MLTVRSGRGRVCEWEGVGWLLPMGLCTSGTSFQRATNEDFSVLSKWERHRRWFSRKYRARAYYLFSIFLSKSKLENPTRGAPITAPGGFKDIPVASREMSLKDTPTRKLKFWVKFSFSSNYKIKSSRSEQPAPKMGSQVKNIKSSQVWNSRCCHLWVLHRNRWTFLQKNHSLQGEFCADESSVENAKLLSEAKSWILDQKRCGQRSPLTWPNWHSFCFFILCF